VDPTTASFVGLSVLLLSGVLSWEDVKSEKGAWDTLIWFAALLMMANQLKKLGFTTWFGGVIGESLSVRMGPVG
jgi:DASS family divalent anion:Na+ symporter